MVIALPSGPLIALRGVSYTPNCGGSAAAAVGYWERIASVDVDDAVVVSLANFPVLPLPEFKVSLKQFL